MMIGEAIHQLLGAHFPIGAGEQEYAKKHGDVEIRGRVDRILGDTIIEFKTTADLPRKGPAARLRHVDQLQLYFWLTGLSRGILVYISRLTGRVKSFAVYRDEERISTLLERATIYAKHLREGTIPDAEEGPLCKYCPFRQDCLKLQARAGQEQAQREA